MQNVKDIIKLYTVKYNTKLLLDICFCGKIVKMIKLLQGLRRFCDFLWSYFVYSCYVKDG